MQIKQKLEYPFWKTPHFFCKSLLISIKLLKTGILTILIDNKIFNKKIEFIKKIFNFIFDNKNEKEIGIKLLHCLINLGPGYIKFGQALSTRPDLVGKIICDSLKNLQDNIKPISTCSARNIILSENENFLKENLSSFDEIPIASASVAQVHTGVLKTGKKVAIKILKPNIQ